MIIDCYAGLGGWDEGLRNLGRTDTIGIELDRDACQTAVAAGHQRIQADITTWPLDHMRGHVEGLVMSPPCTDFSLAGKKRGTEGTTGNLIYTVPEWVDRLRPEWVACEQVPPALPYWTEFATQLETLGYRTWCGILNSADYGVPQTRRRAILLASLRQQPTPPAPTHAKRPEPTLFGEPLSPWVTMAQALGWGTPDFPYPTLACSNRSGGPDKEKVGGSWDRARLYDAMRSESWVLDRRANYRDGKPTVRPIPVADEPAPTVVSAALTGGVWIVRPADPDPTSWATERPSTTIVSSFRPDIVAAPGWRTDPKQPRQNAEGSIRITTRDALILQSFPPDYPVHGSRTSQFRQIGNAIPPRPRRTLHPTIRQPMNQHLTVTAVTQYLGTSHTSDPYQQIRGRLAYDLRTRHGKLWDQRIRRAIRRGHFHLNDAEDLAHLLDTHPTLIWGHNYHQTNGDNQR